MTDREVVEKGRKRDDCPECKKMREACMTFVEASDNLIAQGNAMHRNTMRWVMDMCNVLVLWTKGEEGMARDLAGQLRIEVRETFHGDDLKPEDFD